jgi:putative FmdB family regulatory protein
MKMRQTRQALKKNQKSRYNSGFWMIFPRSIRMPIYAYRCEACGFAKDVLQKLSDPQLTVCLSCGKETFKKQVTAAGFQLKGTGWYVTDFRGGSGGTSAAPVAGESQAAASNEAGGAAKTEAKPETKSEVKSETKSETKSEAKPAGSS